MRVDGGAEKWLAHQGISVNRSVTQPRVALYTSFTRTILQGFSPSPVRPEAIYVLQIGRFGNSFQQLANAMRLADRLAIKKIVIEPTPWLVDSFVTSKGLAVHQTRHSSRNLTRLDAVIVGRFLWEEELAYEGPTMSEGEAASELQHHLSFPLKDQDFGPGDLVIHLRGGDVYSDDPPHDYGQPPLGFYLAILDAKQWNSVTVIHEDDNPVVLNALRQALKQLGIAYFFQSSTLHEDLSVLLAAQNLVVGNGSFARAVCALSPHLRRVFRLQGTYGLGELPTSAKEFEVSDIEGTFFQSILNGNWNNTPSQRELMLTYRKENFHIDNLK